MADKPKIYFLGAGAIAVPVLRALTQSDRVELVGVGTQCARPAGRNRQCTPTPVGAYAAAWGVEIEEVASVNTPEFLEHLRVLAPDIILVVSFGQILRKDILELPPKGCVNIHASLLPHYRGASPIIQSVLNRDTETGVAFMRMERGLDTGPVYQMIGFSLDHTEYASELEGRLGYMAGENTPGILCSIFRGEIEPVPQDGIEATVCTKIRKSDGRIRWMDSDCEIDAMVRAYHPWPGAFTMVRTSKGEEKVTLEKVSCLEWTTEARPGEVLVANKHSLVVACGRGALEIHKLSPQGRCSMDAVSYLNGLRGEIPEILP